MKTLMHFRDFVNEIMSSNSRLHKQAVLKKYKDDETIQRYLKIAFDPYMVFGISSKKLHKEVAVVDHWPEWCTPTMFNLFDYLETHNSGRDYDIAACQLAMNEVASVDRECAELLEKLICKDLTIGCDAKTINKEIHDLIPTFSVQLANKYFDKPEYLEGFDFVLTTKIDGGRIIAIKENDQVSFYTRAGQRYEGLVDLEKEMLETFPNGIVLDGEITLLDNKGVPSKDAYKAAMKLTRTDGPKHGLKMIAFDYMPISEWKKQESNFEYITRREMLESEFRKNHHTYFEVLPVLYRGKDTSKVLEFLDQAIANQEEGIMINLSHAPYEFKRTNSLLKVKKMQTLDLEIIDFEEGEGRLAGTLGAILVRYKDGNVVKVGSGFSDEIRNMIWDHQDKCLGAICEIQYFEETTNADGGKSLRFPVFKDFRHDKLEADY